MAILTIDDNPSISDTVVFTLPTPDADGCFTSNPYKVNKVVIYYVERDFTSGNLSVYENKTYDLEKLQAAEVAEALACATPTDVNIAAAKRLRYEADSNVSVNPFYFNEAKPVQIVGNDSYPAWLSTDLDNAFLDNTSTAIFTYTWQPQGMREGDYFICWTWTPLIAGDSLSSHLRFALKGDTQTTTSIPTHFTNPDKYITLLDRYTPEMFKMIVSDNDRTPDVLEKFNGAVALGFNALEDLTNQIVDLQDANSIHESLIPYLSNLFDLKLKTSDPTRWRGQIKRAIPLYKMKGTKKGLIEALEHAAITMLGLTQLWEIISSYTWQEAFIFDGDNEFFELEKVALDVDYDNFELWLREADSDIWVLLSSDYVEFITSEGLTTMTWTGAGLSVDPITLIEGDEILVLYKYAEIPDPTAQAIENYIRTLPLMDQRDNRDQIYPLKNWNVRVIAENDSMFDLVIPTRHPYHEFLVYGKIRTEFPYSENIYNMEEYNGSIRNSKDPCDISRDFVDPCTACISSCYNIDLEIENLTNDRILEAQEVLREFTPFHAVLHTFNFLGGVNEFVESPVEEIEALVQINGSEFVVAGEAQMWFNRIILDVENQGILRNELANSSVALASTAGIGYNDEIVMFCPAKKLDNIGISSDGDSRLHILAPSSLAGVYDITTPKGNVVTIDLSSGNPTPGSEPIDNCNNLFANDDTINSCAFTFNINYPTLDGTLCNITQDNLFVFSDLTQNFGLLKTKSQFDVDQGTAATAWKVSIPAYSGTAYTIADILPNGSLVLVDHGGLPGDTSDISYALLDGVTTIAMSVEGELVVTDRARITALSSSILPLANIIDVENYYFKLSTTEYPVLGFVSGTTDQFYVGNYTAGDMASVNLLVNHRLMANEIGYLSHRGMKLHMSGDLETSLGIQNGANSLVVVDEGVENDGFKENFLVVIGDDSYFIAEIDGTTPSGFTTITLSGTDHYWETLSAGGTAVNATIYKYTKNGVTIMGQQFDLPEHTFRTLDRSGRSVITRTDQDGVVTGLSLPEEGNQINELVHQNESISFSIEYADGTSEQGEI